jgi:DHA1 family tetracycline resistance protein-like MFS transporter
MTLWTTVALDLVGFGIIVPILGRYAERFGANGFQVGLLFASYSLAQLLFAPLLGALSDRIGRKPVIIVSLVGTAIGSLVTGAAGSLWVLFAGRIIDGASGGSLSVAQAAVADISTPEQRPRLVGMMGAAFGVGFVLGPAIGGLSSLGGPHVPFFVAAALAGGNAIAAVIRLPETHRVDRSAAAAVDAPAPGRRRRFALPSSEVLRRLAVVGFLSTLAFTAFESTFTLFGSARFGFTEGSAAAVFLGVGLVLVAMQGGAYAELVARFGVGRVFRAALVVTAAGLACLAAATTWPVLIVALLLLSVGQGCASPSITTIVTERAGAHERGAALGFQQSAYAVARVIGPPVAGLLFDHVGVPSPSIAGAVLVLVAAGLVAAWGLHRLDAPVPTA